MVGLNGRKTQTQVSANAPNCVIVSLIVVVGVAIVQVLVPGVSAIARVLSRRPKVASSLIRCFLKIFKYPDGISTERIFLR